MKNGSQQAKLANTIVISIHNGKYKIRFIRPLRDHIPEELIKNVLLKIS